MRYSISQVATISGVSARTLRHYDEIGLLAPQEVSANGYRWYGRSQLRVLQRILLLRDLDVPLPQIKAILAGEDDEAAALRRHLRLVTAERDRLDAIAGTIRRTLDDLEGRRSLPDGEFFRGLQERRAQLAATLRKKFGTALPAHDPWPSGWTRDDYHEAESEARDLYSQLSRARRADLDPTSSAALDIVAAHYEAVRATWPASPEAYHALADLIESDPAQRVVVGGDDPDLPAWLAAGVRAYAVRRLGHRP
ncbi:MerR family transcriptional regulator [Cellulomonas sp. SLBN-39]|uniref:MerR family transcriptional regulator n=1 Tax=Cellulomonas sp. SLBN-39 TaxID=2768446 RepID=UPI00116E48D7|nr:MerR family transcriptional regulator [Cellulomonas sp. SLBN-39]TQL02269.1 DNA-binding transcriptional MerR regulator [Cellulomonas sp. SLBN-39]